VMEGLENRFRTRWLANGDSGPMILGDAALSCGYLPSGKFVVSARDDPAMRDLLGIGRPRGDSDLSFRQAYMRLGCANNHPGLLRCWDEMLAACERGGVPTLLGRPVRFEKTRSHGKGGGYCLHEGDLPLLAEAAGIHTVLKDDDNWLKYTDALHAVGFGQTNQDLKAVWEDLVRQVEEGKAPFLEGRAVRFDKRRSYGRIAFYLHRGDALTVRKAILRHQAGRLGKPFDENSPEIGNVKPRPSFTRPSLKARRVKPAWVTSGA